MVSLFAKFRSIRVGRNPWTIERRFDQIYLHSRGSSLEGAMKPFCSSLDVMLLGQSLNFQSLAEIRGLWYHWYGVLFKLLYMLINPQFLTGRFYGAEIRFPIVFLFAKFSLIRGFGRNPWIVVRRFDQISLHAHDSSLECATELKFVAPFCSS